MVVSCVMPAMPVSDVAGAIADVSAAGLASLLSQAASRRTAVIARIVFIVTPSGVGSAADSRGSKAITVAGRDARAKVRHSTGLSR
jgi:hypothetical protein